jgi:hypothetical protein
MVRVVVEALGFCTVAPVQSRKDSPVGGGFAEILTTVPEVYLPLPVPFTTVNE